MRAASVCVMGACMYLLLWCILISMSILGMYMIVIGACVYLLLRCIPISMSLQAMYMIAIGAYMYLFLRCIPICVSILGMYLCCRCMDVIVPMYNSNVVKVDTNLY